MIHDISYLKKKVKETKIRTLDMCLKGGYGHPTSAFSCAEIMTVLYYAVMNYDVNDADDIDRDRFIMSKNHAGVVVMPILNDLGYITDEEFDNIMMAGNPITYHTNININGMEFSGGALGIGLGYSAGLALSAKMNQQSWLTFCLVGDAECHEGSIWEAVMFAGHNHLNNLIVVVDQNNRGVSDHTDNMINMEDIESKWSAFGWETSRVNGHCIEELLTVFEGIHERKSDKPLCVIADTVKGYGVDFMADQPLWHGRLPKGEEIELARKQLMEV